MPPLLTERRLGCRTGYLQMRGSVDTGLPVGDAAVDRLISAPPSIPNAAAAPYRRPASHSSAKALTTRSPAPRRGTNSNGVCLP